MATHAQLSFKLPYVLSPEGDWIVASCPSLDVHSQGRSEAEAVAQLREAVQLFLETCLETGTLDTVLAELGFHLAADSLVPAEEEGAGTIDVPLHLLKAVDAEDHAR